MLFYYLRRKSRARRRAVQGVENLFFKKGKSITKKKEKFLSKNKRFGSKIYKIFVFRREFFPNKTFPISKSIVVENN